MDITVRIITKVNKTVCDDGKFKMIDFTVGIGDTIERVVMFRKDTDSEKDEPRVGDSVTFKTIERTVREYLMKSGELVKTNDIIINEFDIIRRA